MEYALGTLCTLNRILQAEKPLLHTLKPQIENMVEGFARNFMSVPEDFNPLDVNVEDSSLHYRNSAVYLGIIVWYFDCFDTFLILCYVWRE